MLERLAERYLRRLSSRSIVQNQGLSALLRWQHSPEAIQETRKRALSKFGVSSYVATALSMAHHFQQTENFASGARPARRSERLSSFDRGHLQNTLLDLRSRLSGPRHQAQGLLALLQQQCLITVSIFLECRGATGQRTLGNHKRWGSSPVNLGVQGQFAL